MVEFSDLFESEAEEFQKKAKVGSVPSINSTSPLCPSRKAVLCCGRWLV